MGATECCPRFNPEPWDGKIFRWDNRKFIKDRVFTLFYIPINFGKIITRLNRLMQKAGAGSPDWLCLADHTSRWNMNIYLAVDKTVPDAQNTLLSGRFVSKVYEGPFKDTPKWCKDFEGYLESLQLEMKKMYMWYTTCPKCAKKYGRNYVVIIAEIK